MCTDVWMWRTPVCFDCLSLYVDTIHALMRGSLRENKAWLAPHMDRLLGDVAVLHSPFFGSGKLEYYLAARRPGLEVRGEPLR